MIVSGTRILPDVYKRQLVDRMNKRFVRATKAELKNVLSKNVEFSRLEKILMDASLPGGKTEPVSYTHLNAFNDVSCNKSFASSRSVVSL